MTSRSTLRATLAAVVVLTALPGAVNAQLPPAPTVSPALGPEPPTAPLGRLETVRDGAARLGCPVTVVEGLGAVTARHCVGDQAAPAGLAVRFGDERRAVVAARVPDVSAFDDQRRFARPQHDWAILELDGRPPRSDVFPYVGRAGLVAADRLNPLVKLGPGRKPTDRPVRGACWPTDVAAEGRVFAFRCSEGTGPGRSGSPLLVRLERGYGFVGIHVAEFDGPDGKTGIAIVPPLP